MFLMKSCNPACPLKKDGGVVLTKLEFIASHAKFYPEPAVSSSTALSHFQTTSPGSMPLLPVQGDPAGCHSPSQVFTPLGGFFCNN